MEIPLNTLRTHDPRCSVFNTCGSRLYHYTSLQTMALILKFKTIRFNRLDRVNDPRECLSSDHLTAQTLVFASCWTDSQEESIPHWKMYAGLAGVRIGLPTLMFRGQHNNHKVTRDDRLYELSVDAGPDQPPAYHIERRGNHYHVSAGSTVYGPTRIRYLEDETQLTMPTVYPSRTAAKYDIRALGTQKHSSWQFEKEVRFRVLAIGGYGSEGHEHYMSPESISASPVITEFVDIPLDPCAFDDAEIVLGPKATIGDEILLRSLCKEHAPNARISLSQIILR